MYYLSRVPLDACNRNTMKALANPGRFHGAVESSFPGERKRRLWRIDRLNGKIYLLILSEDQPRLTGMEQQFSAAGEKGVTKSYDAFLSGIHAGEEFRFRLAANPSKAIALEQKRGKIVANITPTYQKQWLLNRSKAHGFSVKEEAFDITESRWVQFHKTDPQAGKSRYVRFLMTVYEGLLQVTDEENFRKILVEGLGREKAFGCGLLTVMRIG